MVGQALISRMEEPEGQRLGNGTGPLEAVNLVTIGECGTGMTVTRLTGTLLVALILGILG